MSAELLRHAQTEKELQQSVIDLARLSGWLIFHDQDSRKNAPGLPDLILVREGKGGKPGRLILAELKRQNGRLRAEQKKWLSALSSVPGIEVYVWRPSDWEQIEAVLGRRR